MTKRARRRPYDPSKAPKAHDPRLDRLVHERDLPRDAHMSTIYVRNPEAMPDDPEQYINVSRALSHKDKIGQIQVRDHLAWLHAHKDIDEAQYHAGRQWQTLYERASIGAIQSVNTEKEPVDGGRWPDLLTDNRAQASAELKRLDKAMGEGASIVRAVLGQGMLISVACGSSSHWAAQKAGRQIIDSLEILARELGFTNVRK